MLQNLKPLLVILTIIALMHMSLRGSLTPKLLSQQTLRSLSLGWVGVSVLLFLSPNFWVFLLGAAVLLWYLGQAVHPAILLCGLFYAAPYLDKVIPGVGGINALFGLSYPRLLAMVALGLWWARWRPKNPEADTRLRLFDRIVLIIGLYRLALQVQDDTVTNTIREYSYYLLDVMLVYWIGRRWVADRALIKESLSAFAFGVMIVCGIAAFEFAKRWLLYSTLAQTLDVPGTTGRYLSRGDTGLLRTFATTGHSIPMGYLAMVGILIWLGLSEAYKLPRRTMVLGLLIMAAGSIASLSRGPWVALVGALVLWYSMSPQGLKRLITAFAVLSALVGFALLTPARDEIISMIPWVGEADNYNIDYRERLIQVSYFMISENPWFGSATFMSAPIMQQLIQGQGIIDLVNTYVAIALSSGLIGTGLFVSLLAGPLLMGMAQYLKLLKRAKVNNAQELADPLFRAFLCVLFATIITIGTVSSITIIPWTYWLFIGVAVGTIQHYAMILSSDLRGNQ